MDYRTIKNIEIPEVVQTYDERDTILYGLAVGYGFDPTDERQLRYVYEEGLVAAPSMAAVLGHPGFWMRDLETGIDWVKVLHGEQAVTIHEPLPPAATVVGRTRVTAIVDKGPEKGAIVYQEKTVTDQETGRLLATVEPVTFCRGDGGLDQTDDPPGNNATPPEGEADAVCDLPTVAQSALIYRLCGDPNPLHVLPSVAASAGFDRPILHGLCTFGVATHGVLRTYGDYEPDALSRVAGRFSSPVYPGETVRVEMWHRENEVVFQARSVERDVVVMTNGSATLRNP